MNEELQKQIDAINAKASLGEQSSPDTEFSGGESSDTYNPKYIEMIRQNQAAAQPMTAPQQDVIGTAGKAAMMAGAVPTPASPALMAAGLGLQAAGMISQAKQQRDRQKYEAKLNQAKARQSALDNLANISSRLKV